jgi:cysteine desulfurase
LVPYVFWNFAVIYFDANATTQPTTVIANGIIEALSAPFGNPSSAHAAGLSARKHIQQSRKRVAALLNTVPEGVIFTSGATEANNSVLKSCFAKEPFAQIVSSPVEHDSVHTTLSSLAENGCATVRLHVDSQGLINLAELEKALETPTSLVSIQWVNSETGIVQPIAEIVHLCRQHGARLHVDAAQAFGRIPIDLSQYPIDYLSLSGHKLHAPAGIGALIMSTDAQLQPLIHGGGHEMGFRAGTENILGAIAVGIAAKDRQERFHEIQDHLSNLCKTFEKLLLKNVPGAHIIGFKSQRVGNTSCMRFERVDGQALVAQLSALGLMCSQGSACHNHRPEPSHVLLAMGLTEQQAYECVRFSFSELNTFEELDPAVKRIMQCVTRLRAF